MLFALCFSVCMGSVLAQELDVSAIQARIAEQEAQITDLQARMNQRGQANANYDGAPEGIISLNKNAVVTIGGLLTTKYQYTDAKVDSIFDEDGVYGGNTYQRRAKAQLGDLAITDAKVYMQVDVNDYFDAYLEMDLQNNAEDYDNAEVYYVRWKNICNSGFGIKVGRDALVFGDDNAVGDLGTYAAGGGDAFGDIDYAGNFANHMGFIAGPTSSASLIPSHNGWDVSGVTQVTPYWEGFDGKFKAELSFFQHVYDDEALISTGSALGDEPLTGWYLSGRTYKSKNYGTVSARVAFTPVEDLTITASFANYRQGESDPVHNADNQVYGLAFNYRPSFFNRLYTWGQWVHGHDVHFHRGMTSDALNFGMAFDITDSLTVFAQGDYLRTKYTPAGNDQKGTAWAAYGGIQYNLPYGATLEAGWKHEVVKYKSYGTKIAKGKADTLYGLIGFEF